MPLDANADYEAFKTMMWRFLKFDSRDGGAVADGKAGPTVFERLNASATPETGVIANTEQNYKTLAGMIQRGYRFDIRPNGLGATGTLGPTLWERLNGVETAASSPLTPAQVKVIADAVVAAIGTPTVKIDYAAIADAVNDDAAKRLAS